MSGIVWLASYPKSGNTWFRVFLANLLSGEKEVGINELNSTGFADRNQFDHVAGWESSDLLAKEIFQLRRPVQEAIACESGTVYMKVHEAFTHPAGDHPLFSLPATRAALYFIRNPLDVALSFSHHRGKSVDDTIAYMGKKAAGMANYPDRLDRQIPQPLRDWSGHVKSWVEAPGLRLHIMRFEDMLKRPQEVFTEACRFLGLSGDPTLVSNALENSRFEKLQQQERDKGFIESPSPGRQFFRQGRAGGWADVLSRGQIDTIVGDHGKMMRRFGYLNPDGTLPN
jgi:aryl sulfotransferase